MGKFIDLTGQKFGRLLVLKYIGNSYWLCKCECGNKKNAKAYDLKIGKVQSCGCLNVEKNKKLHTKHGLCNHRLNNIWQSMKQRCYNKNNPKYKNYGGRGITICEEWLDNFINFYNWAMANGYQDDLTIDRINVNGNYEPNNCRFVNNKIQSNNKTTNLYITYNSENHTLKEWSNILNINYYTLHKRITKYKWDIKRAFTQK